MYVNNFKLKKKNLSIQCKLCVNKIIYIYIYENNNNNDDDTAYRRLKLEC